MVVSELALNEPSVFAPAASDAAFETPARTPGRFIFRVANGKYRPWIVALVATETLNATSGILLPYALSRIIGSVTGGQLHTEQAWVSLATPLALFAGLCVGELVFGRVSSALQLRLAPRQRQYVARGMFAYLHQHSHRFLTENFAGALAHRISETSHGVNQVLWSVISEFWPIGIVIAVSNALLFATKQFFFPTAISVLEDPAFAGQESEFYGGQKVNELFADISTTVDTDWQWLPFMEFAYTSFNETFGVQVAAKGDLSAGLDEWQAALEEYATQQGFTVNE